MYVYIYIKFNVAYKILGLYLFDAPIVVSCKEETKDERFLYRKFKVEYRRQDRFNYAADCKFKNSHGTRHDRGEENEIGKEVGEKKPQTRKRKRRR